jgi:sulfoxide reductase heme-binding subunit YedZ
MVAMLLISGSVILGLAMGARMVPQRLRRDAVAVHQYLALIALGAIAAHGLLLAADPWLKAGLKGIAVPFAIGYRPLWTGLGILGGYLAAILGLSFYVRRKIGARLWRRMHNFTVVAYVLSLAHALGSGTDTSIALVRYAMLASALPVLFLFTLRRLRPGGASGGRRPSPANVTNARSLDSALALGGEQPASPAPVALRGSNGPTVAAPRARMEPNLSRVN